ncbi:MAG: ComF family protein [Gammaproteobacteria bacterium]
MHWIASSLTRLCPPSRCELCGGPTWGSDCLCDDCSDDLPHINTSCDCCGRQMHENGRCGDCLKSAPAIHKTVTAYQYRYPLDILVKKYKYNQQLAIARPLANKLSRAILNRIEGELPEVMIPIPLHYKRQYRRGFNQSLEICRELNRVVRVPVDYRLAERNLDTAPMYELSPLQRKGNIRGAFRLRKPCTYQSVVIVDDIITTGATANELARLLLSAGVEYVELWALARAESQ